MIQSYDIIFLMFSLCPTHDCSVPQPMISCFHLLLIRKTECDVISTLSCSSVPHLSACLSAVSGFILEKDAGIELPPTNTITLAQSQTHSCHLTMWSHGDPLYYGTSETKCRGVEVSQWTNLCFLFLTNSQNVWR